MMVRNVGVRSGGAMDRQRSRNLSIFGRFVFIASLLAISFTTIMIPWHHILDISQKYRNHSLALTRTADVSQLRPQTPTQDPRIADLAQSTSTASIRASSSSMDAALIANIPKTRKKPLLAVVKELFDLGKSSPDQLIDLLNATDPLG